MEEVIQAWEEGRELVMKSTATGTWRVFSKSHDADILRKVGGFWTFGHGIEKFSEVKLRRKIYV